jgi:hypothetical protein
MISAGKVPDEEHDVVAVNLELPHLVDENGVSQVQVRRRRVEPGFDHERPAFLEPSLESLLGENFVGAAGKFGNLCRYIGHCGVRWPASFEVANCSTLAQIYKPKLTP